VILVVRNFRDRWQEHRSPRSSAGLSSDARWSRSHPERDDASDADRGQGRAGREARGAHRRLDITLDGRRYGELFDFVVEVP